MCNDLLRCSSEKLVQLQIHAISFPSWYFNSIFEYFKTARCQHLKQCFVCSTTCKSWHSHNLFLCRNAERRCVARRNRFTASTAVANQLLRNNCTAWVTKQVSKHRSTRCRIRTDLKFNARCSDRFGQFFCCHLIRRQRSPAFELRWEVFNRVSSFCMQWRSSSFPAIALAVFEFKDVNSILSRSTCVALVCNHCNENGKTVFDCFFFYVQERIRWPWQPLPQHGGLQQRAQVLQPSAGLLHVAQTYNRHVPQCYKGKLRFPWRCAALRLLSRIVNLKWGSVVLLTMNHVRSRANQYSSLFLCFCLFLWSGSSRL